MEETVIYKDEQRPRIPGLLEGARYSHEQRLVKDNKAVSHIAFAATAADAELIVKALNMYETIKGMR